MSKTDENLIRLLKTAQKDFKPLSEFVSDEIGNVIDRIREGKEDIQDIIDKGVLIDMDPRDKSLRICIKPTSSLNLYWADPCNLDKERSQ